eukprot:7453008-Alexandrium_andersonii.AAC.1
MIESLAARHAEHPTPDADMDTEPATAKQEDVQGALARLRQIGEDKLADELAKKRGASKVPDPPKVPPRKCYAQAVSHHDACKQKLEAAKSE